MNEPVIVALNFDTNDPTITFGTGNDEVKTDTEDIKFTFSVTNKSLDEIEEVRYVIQRRTGVWGSITVSKDNFDEVYESCGSGYGYCLPMDDCLCQVALDFGGRAWLVWDAEFKREKIGEMPTEMFLHFFKSLSDAAKMNLNIKAEGQNEHHKIEGIFKALARAIKMAVKRDIYHFEVPSSKGSL